MIEFAEIQENAESATIRALNGEPVNWPSTRLERLHVLGRFLRSAAATLADLAIAALAILVLVAALNYRRTAQSIVNAVAPPPIPLQGIFSGAPSSESEIRDMENRLDRAEKQLSRLERALQAPRGR